MKASRHDYMSLSLGGDSFRDFFHQEVLFVIQEGEVRRSGTPSLGVFQAGSRGGHSNGANMGLRSSPDRDEKILSQFLDKAVDFKTFSGNFNFEAFHRHY